MPDVRFYFSRQYVVLRVCGSCAVAGVAELSSHRHVASAWAFCLGVDRLDGQATATRLARFVAEFPLGRGKLGLRRFAGFVASLGLGFCGGMGFRAVWLGACGPDGPAGAGFENTVCRGISSLALPDLGICHSVVGTATLACLGLAGSGGGAGAWVHPSVCAVGGGRGFVAGGLGAAASDCVDGFGLSASERVMPRSVAIMERFSQRPSTRLALKTIANQAPQVSNRCSMWRQIWLWFKK